MNPASRLCDLFESFNSANPNETIKEAWERYMGSKQAPLSEDEVLDVIQAVLAEIRTMEAKLKEINVPANVYAQCVDQLRAGFSPTQLSTRWSAHREAMLKRATPLALEWASWALSRFDENEIDDEDMESLRTSLADQEKLLRETNLPTGLRQMLERQTAALRRALHLYKIQGVEPLRKAVSDSVGELRTASTELVATVNAGDSSTKEAHKNGLALLGKFAEVTDKGSKVMKFAKDTYELGTSAWSSIQGLLP